MYSDVLHAVNTPKVDLNQSFSNTGALVKTLPLRFTGDVSGLPPCSATVACRLNDSRMRLVSRLCRIKVVSGNVLFFL